MRRADRRALPADRALIGPAREFPQLVLGDLPRPEEARSQTVLPLVHLRELQDLPPRGHELHILRLPSGRTGRGALAAPRARVIAHEREHIELGDVELLHCLPASFGSRRSTSIATGVAIMWNSLLNG